MEFLIRIDVRLPARMDEDAKSRVSAAEAARGQELGRAGVIRAMWRVPGRLANVGIWSVPGPDELHAAISSLPMWPYMRVEVTAIATHDLAPHLPFTCGPLTTATPPPAPEPPA